MFFGRFGVKMKVCVLIPSYNEEGTIGTIVRDVKNMGLEPIIVDDGSLDNTSKIASENGAAVIRHKKNRGKGASIKEGFEYILKNTSFDTIIIMDADGQHHPEDIEKFLEHARKYNDDIVIGNRMNFTKDMPPIRFVTNKFMSFLLSAMCKQSIPDTQCGFRLVKKDVFKKIKFDSNKYDFDSELIIKASRENMKIASVPIKTIYKGERSEIHPIKDTLRFIGLLISSYKK